MNAVLLFLTISFILLTVYSVDTGPFLRYKDLNGAPYTVESDQRSWIINGQRTLLLGGSVHYPRLSPGQWKDILTKMLDDGLNHAEIYVFWNLHEPSYDFNGNHKYNYEGRANLTGFLDMAKEVGLFINLRIGPYVCAEWSFGGLPVWLLHVPDISFRDDNEPWKKYMQLFVQEIASKTEPYLSKNGGPIIMAQIENEYRGSQSYIDWCGDVVNDLDMDVSWVMCNGMSSNNTINTCNGNNCYSYAKSHQTKYPNDPLGWTENEGWFQVWSKDYDPESSGWANRSPQDMAYSVALWFAVGAAHHNYYMWYGGNHVSWTAGNGIANYYADGVNLHADGLPHEPKKSHLMRLHNILNKYGEYPLLESEKQLGQEIYPIDNNTNVFAYIYHSTSQSTNLTFLCNVGSSLQTLTWQSKTLLSISAHSVLIFDNDNTLIYNTSQITNISSLATKRTYETLLSDMEFTSWTEEYPNNYPHNRPNRPVVSDTPLEQIRFSNNTFEYVVYATNFTLTSDDNDGTIESVEFVGRTANAYIVYIDATYVGQVWDGTHASDNKTYKVPINITFSVGLHTLTIVSSSLGIANAIHNEQPAWAQDVKGILDSNVTINTNTGSSISNMSNDGWQHWIGRTGEMIGVGVNANIVTWKSPSDTTKAMTWYKTTFYNLNASYVNDNDGVILLDIGDNASGMKRGHFWFNGMDMGHYNNVIVGKPVQQYYFIPKDYIRTEDEKITENVLIFAEELPNPNPSNVKIVFSTFVVP